ncbi:uncharacterized protein H6S33_005451 [Morchella sextelata]|uniref:uncharacterized protein n=1 Tax=Morchella sextelata TaxID=1174677 RepID=UPI001D03813E|nr:uncharacterized protein H6S33_005451 [Morchella sextelata]KAH0613565.1 hypothetical protein H6S33_005451 [Morchella sextelata]
MAGKKDKKKVDKKARVAEKTARKTAQKEKKNTKKGKNNADEEVEDVDLDQVLAEYALQQAQFLKVTETPLSTPPPVRANATLTASPNGKELFLFGGETFNGSIAKFFNELYIFNADREDWRQITSPNSPLPRSGHFVASSQHGGGSGSLWLFGGEFSSPKQGTFYHYNDFWRFDCASREWNRVEGKSSGKAGGGTPPARSGHRMVAWKNFILLMGGFQDTSTTPKYLADLWAFDTVHYTWTQISLPAHAQRPEARSSFSFLPHEAGAVIYGGYARVKTSALPSAGKKGAKAQGSSKSVTYKPVMYQDTWLLRMDPDLSKVRWERRKKPGNPPNPPRVGVTMAWHKGRGILFGGVRDEEETEEALDSEFFNDLFAWGTDRNRFFPLVLRKPRTQQKRVAERGGGRRDRAKEDEEELLRNLAALEATGKMASETPEVKVEMDIDESEKKKAPVELSLELPHKRFNCAMAVLDDVLYGYGGTFEKGDREFMMDDMFAIDLGKLDGVRTIFSRKDETVWEDSEDEDEDDDEDDDEDEEDEDEMDVDDEGEAEKIVIGDEEIEARRKEKVKRKKEKGKETVPEAVPEPIVEDEEEAPIDETPDPTPHPRPFETLREFFARTSTAWQDLLIAQLESSAGEKSKTIKELRKVAFQTAEDKWWACREEIRALEDEQEEAGIGEVVNMADMAAGTGGGAGGGGVGRRR